MTACEKPLQDFDTAPPDEEPVLRRIKRRTVERLSVAVMPLVKRTAGAYLGGETIEEALCVVRRLEGEAIAATLGYWDAGADVPERVEGLYRAALSALPDKSGVYLSLKPPTLHFSHPIAQRLAQEALARGIRLHCDSHGAEVAAATNGFASALAEILPPEKIGITLPGRWQRSLSDAGWAMEKGFCVRVVKGQWPDPADAQRDPSQGFLAVIDRLCQGARLVAVGTQDFALGREALLRLQAAKIPCELEVLLGLPAKPLIGFAREAGIKLRVYVPYGPGFVPNAIGVLRRNPRLVWAVAKDRIAAAGQWAASPFRPH